MKQTIGAATTQYLLDLQPGLAVVLAQTAATDRFVHGPMGLHAQLDAAGGWEWPLMDGLGSVRTVAGSTNAVLETRTYDPYGQPLGSTGTPQTPFGFTGEQTDANGLLYLRARHYAPAIGAFTARDPGCRHPNIIHENGFIHSRQKPFITLHAVHVAAWVMNGCAVPFMPCTSALHP